MPSLLENLLALDSDTLHLSLLQLEKVRIGHDGRGLGTGWYLEEVVIIIHDECWIFPCNRWLADYEDDGKTERDLYAGRFYITMKNLVNPSKKIDV